MTLDRSPLAGRSDAERGPLVVGVLFAFPKQGSPDCRTCPRRFPRDVMETQPRADAAAFMTCPRSDRRTQSGPAANPRCAR